MQHSLLMTSIQGKSAACRPQGSLAQVLWQYDAQVGIAAAPMTYALDGVQYIAIVVAPPLLYIDPKIRTGPGRLLVFALDGKATLPPRVERPEVPIPPPAAEVAATPAELEEGARLNGMY